MLSHAQGTASHTSLLLPGSACSPPAPPPPAPLPAWPPPARPPARLQDFAALQLDEIEKNIASRRNKIFLLMEEVRRLRIQLRLRGGAEDKDTLLAEEEYPSTIPFFPPVTEKTVQLYTRLYAAIVAAIIAFGGIVAPVLEVKLGIGGGWA